MPVTNRHDHPHHHEEEDEVYEIQESTPLYIFDSQQLEEDVPAGFNTVKIALDGTLKSDLVWNIERQAAQKAVAKGFKIFWEIDLGLFDRLKHPLDNQTQFLSLALSLEHFRDSLWKDFKDNTAGLCLFRGDIRYDRSIKWNDVQLQNLRGWLQDLKSEETPDTLRNTPEGERLLALFCRDAAGEYLDLLASRMPDQLACYIALDATQEADKMLVAQLLTKERYPRLTMIVKGAKNLGGELGWEDGSLASGFLSRSKQESITHSHPVIGICLPPMVDCRAGSIEGLSAIIEQITHFKVIPETSLTTEWDGLDTLYVNRSGLTPQGARKLAGFEAAGGTIHFLP